jgi:hypothetical protein
MDWSRSFWFFPITVICYLLFLLFWNKFILKKTIKYKEYPLFLIAGVLINWGIVILERLFEVQKLEHTLKIGLGAWFIFVFSHHLKTIKLNEWSFKECRQVFLGEILSFFVIAIMIYVLT